MVSVGSSYQICDRVMFECMTCRRWVPSFIRPPDSRPHHTLLVSQPDPPCSLSGIEQWPKTERLQLSWFANFWRAEGQISTPCLCKQAEIRAMKTKAMFWKEVVDHIFSDLKSHTTPCWRSRQSRKSVVLILWLLTLLILVLPLFVFANTSWRCCVSGWLGIGAPSLLHQSRSLSVVPALLPDLKPWFCHLLVAYTMCLSLFIWKMGIIAVPPEVVMGIKINSYL